MTAYFRGHAPHVGTSSASVADTFAHFLATTTTTHFNQRKGRSMSDRNILHDFTDLPDLRSMELEAWGWPKHWGVCTIGNIFEKQGVLGGTGCVQFHEVEGDDITTHYYPIPENVRFLMGHAQRRSRQETQQKIRSALGL
jgi:hypothetical protein